jgi:hypothetical protein
VKTEIDPLATNKFTKDGLIMVCLKMAKNPNWQVQNETLL